MRTSVISIHTVINHLLFWHDCGSMVHWKMAVYLSVDRVQHTSERISLVVVLVESEIYQWFRDCSSRNEILKDVLASIRGSRGPMDMQKFRSMAIEP